MNGNGTGGSNEAAGSTSTRTQLLAARREFQFRGGDTQQELRANIPLCPEADADEREWRLKANLLLVAE